MKRHITLHGAVKVAEQLKQRLVGVCQRIEIAGSIRRRCDMVRDIELVAIAKHHADLFGQPYGSVLDDELRAWPGQWPKMFCESNTDFNQKGGGDDLLALRALLQPGPRNAAGTTIRRLSVRVPPVEPKKEWTPECKNGIETHGNKR